MKKRLFLLLAICMAIVPTALAHDFSVVVPSGQTLYFNQLSSNAVEVTSENTSSPYYTTYPSGDLVIPATVTFNDVTYNVTSIGYGSFRNCGDLTSVSIPNSVTTIGEYTFYGCSGLTSVTIPNSVSAIGSFAFAGCSLISVTIPNSVTSIGSNVFITCSSLSSIVVEAGNTHYDSRDNCNAIIQTDLNLLIQGCSSTVIPTSVSSIGSYAFYYCSVPSTVTIPNSVTSIGDFAFSGCTGLTSVTIPSSVTSIGRNAFSGCTGLTSVTIPNLVTSIDEYVFSGCSGLISVDIPNSVTSIGMDAFSECSALTTVTIPNTVTSIGGYSFKNCSSLISVTIPNLVTSIGYQAFYGCSGLTSVYCESATPPLLSSYAFSCTNCPLYVPCGFVTVYQNATNWSDYASHIQMRPFNYAYNFISSNETMGTVNFGEVDCDSNITIIATANPGYIFDQWSDGNSNNPRTLMVTQDTSLVAYFVAATSPLVEDSLFTVVANNAMGGGVYPAGSTAVVFALPQVDLQFAGWSDNETANPRYIVVTSDTTLTALYRAPDTVRVYDTTTVYDTVINIVHDTTEYNHYYYDTVHVYDTLVVLDTTRIYDTVFLVSVDTLHHYFYDTTRVFDTMVFVSMDTLYHYYYDTTRVFDTLVISDTVHHYFFDSTMVYDTTSITHYVFDTTRVFDSVWVFDSVYVTDTLFLYFFDTVYIPVPVQGIDGEETVTVKVYTYQNKIIVEGAQGMAVRLYDINGRLLATKMEDADPIFIYVQTSGTYLVRVGDLPARRVVVIR